MSLVHLTSKGQMPNQFSNFFSNGIQLGAGAEVSLVGYSGNLAGEDNSENEVYEIVIQAGVNDKFAVIHGDMTRATGTTKDIAYTPVEVKISPAVYTPEALGDELERILNISERISQYKGGWSVTYNDATAVPPIEKFSYTIQCGHIRAPALAGGEFINYITGGSAAADGVANGGASSTLTPYQVGPPVLQANSFIDTTPGYMGDTTEGVGVIGGGAGYNMEFTTVGATTNADVAYSLCMVAKQNASRMNFSNPNGDYPQDSPTVWSEEMDVGLDFAFGEIGAELFGFCPHGITINPADGRFGTIEAKTQNVVGDPKDPSNFEITWYPTIVNVAAPGLKKMWICPRHDAAGDLIIEYWVDNGAGPILLATSQVSGSAPGDHGTYRYSQNYYMGVLCNAPVATSPVITAKRSPPPTLPPLTAAPFEDITFAWSPYDGHDMSLGSLLNAELISESGLWAAARNANKLGQSLGFPAQDTILPKVAAHTTGLSSLESLGEATNNGEYSPLLITCPSLPITGYIGGSSGTTAALLGVGRVRGNELKYGFSSELAENWIQLRNTKPITLYQLAIDIKTETNNDYIGLEPNFSCWLKFRSTGCAEHKRNDVVGVIRN